MFKALTLPLLVTLLLHGIILAIVLIDMPDSKPLVKKATTRYIEARLVTLDKPKAQPAPKPAPAAKPKPAPKPKPQVDDQAKRQAEQKARKEAEYRAQQQAKQRAAEAERSRREQEQQEQQERQRRQEEQRRRQQEAERELAEAVAREQAYMQAQNDAELANSYIALITEAVQGQWDRPPSARNDMEAELALQLVPTGEVVSVVVVKSSGNAAFDRSAETAVLRAGRFPELQQLPNRVFEQYFRRLRLKFRPEDLRL